MGISTKITCEDCGLELSPSEAWLITPPQGQLKTFCAQHAVERGIVAALGD